MNLGIVVVTLLVLCGTAVAERARYDNYRVYKVFIDTAEQLEVLKMIEASPDGVSYIII